MKIWLLENITRLFIYLVTRFNILYIVKRAFLRHQLLLVKKSYYLPIPEPEDYKYIKRSKLVGLKFNDKNYLNIFKNIILKYKEEFSNFPITPNKGLQEYYLLNGSFMSIDAHVYYAMVRYYKPKKIIEIGSGYTTLICAEAILKNKIKDEFEGTKLFCIDPYPKKHLKQKLRKISTLRISKLQDIKLSFFESLKAGDILFIDSTHTFMAGGDVWYLYCEILPRLSPGVIIHIHDIELPKPYPQVYIDREWYFTEQYVLQAMLAHSTRYEILWPGSYMMQKYEKLLKENFKKEYSAEKLKYNYAWPSSFWMKVTKT